MTLAERSPGRSRPSRRAIAASSSSSSSTTPARPNQPLFIAIAWVEAHCRIPDGFRAGEPFLLYRWQKRWYVNYYLVRGDVEFNPAAPILSPAFVYRYGLLIGPQGIGKNPLIATQCCLEGVGPSLFGGWAGTDDGWACADHGCPCGWEYLYESGEPMGMARPTPLIQITAFSEDSTDNTYDALRPMIALGPLADVMPKAGEEFIRLPGGGRIDTVTSSNQSRLGQRATWVPQDELGLWTPQNKMTKLQDTQLRNVSKMGGRGAGTSNAWDPAEDSVAKREFGSASRDVYRQMVPPPAHLSFGNKAERRRIFLAVYEPEVRRENGGHVDLDSIEAQAVDLINKGDLPQAARFYGNLTLPGAGAATDPKAWAALARPRGPTGDWSDGMPPAGTHIGAGFDGSIYRDVTALRGCTRDGYRFRIATWRRPQGSDMLAWQAEHPGEEWRIPRDEVHSAVAWLLDYYVIGRFEADPPKWDTEIIEWSEWAGEDTDGKPVVRAFDTNQATRMAPAFDRWLVGVAEGLLHDGDPEAAAHVAALHKKKVKLADVEDDRTRYIPTKGDDKAPIDIAIADILALEAAMTMPDPPGPSVYETRGFRILNRRRTCPQCNRETLARRKDPPGWRCQVREGGCGQVFDPDDERLAPEAT